MTPDSRLPAPDLFMHRCIELATLGSGYVAPNPMVGAILVHQDRIIGEGWHQKFGEAHAEVNCIASVKESDKPLITHSTLYVSLEPCTHFGKTPPCTNLIIEQKISKVVIGCSDPNVGVSGGGIKKLQAAGLKVESGILEDQCLELNKRFFTFHLLQRPYVVLKWAQTADGKIAPPPPEGGISKPYSTKNTFLFGDFKAPPSEDLPAGKAGFGEASRLLISNENTNRLVHKWRSEESSILVGTNTALLDDPELTNRHWEGPSPVRMAIDIDLKLPKSLKLFNGKQKTIIFNATKHSMDGNPGYYKLSADESLVPQVLNALYQMQIQSVMVEGGAKLLQSFIDSGIWDEARVITNKELNIGIGLPAPRLINALKTEEQIILSDIIEVYQTAG